MQIRDLEWLLAVAEHEHVTDTAAVLGVSQPTLSRALARVEAELGARLFSRAPDGVHLTALGATVVEGAREVVGRYGQLLADVAGELDPDSGVARLAFLDSMATSLVPQLLRDFHAEAPGVRVLLSQEPAHEIEADLARGAVDLAITSVRAEGGGWHVLQEERLVVVVPPTHRLADRSRVRLDELAGEELVTTPAGYGFRHPRRRPAARGRGQHADLLREPGPGHHRGTRRRGARGGDRPRGVRGPVGHPRGAGGRCGGRPPHHRADVAPGPAAAPGGRAAARRDHGTPGLSPGTRRPRSHGPGLGSIQSSGHTGITTTRRGPLMTRLIDELNALHASYVDAINAAVAHDDVTTAADLAADYDRDAILLMAEREGRQDLLPLFGLDADGGRVSVQRDTPLRRLVQRVGALRAA